MRGYAYLTPHLRRSRRGAGRRSTERGDVPGWVMITVMTAALVLAILIPFRAAIVATATNALSSVTSGG